MSKEELVVPSVPTRRIFLNIEGLSPLLQNKPPTESLDSRKERKEKRKEALDKAYFWNGEDGKYAITNNHFQQAFIEGAYYGEWFPSGMKEPATVFSVNGQKGELIKLQTPEMVVDSRITSLSGAGSAKITHRPRFDDWKIEELSVDVSTSKMTPKDFLEMVAYTGTNVGVGSYRKRNGGPFGRFRLTEAKIME